MKKTKLFLLTFILSWAMLGVNAQFENQDTIRSLVISEWRGGWDRGESYLEFANMGSDTLDLSRFLVQWVNGNGQQLAWENEQWRYATPSTNARLYMSGQLPPGETYLISAAQNGPRADLAARSDTITPAASRNLLFNYGNHCHLLYYFLDNGDSIVIDVANLELTDDLKTINTAADVAGVPECTRTHTLVRKANILQGNVDWETSAGLSFEDSEWMPIHNQRDSPIRDELSFTTAGTHGDYSIALESEVVAVDLGGETLGVPWGTYKYDPLIEILDFGPGMAWNYLEDTTSVADSAHLIVQDGDILRIFAAGNDLESQDLHISVSAPATDLATAFPILRKNINNNWVQPYTITTDLYFTDTSGYYTDTTGYIRDTIGYLTDTTYIIDNTVVPPDTTEIIIDTIGYVFGDTIGYVIDTLGPIIDTLGPAPDMIGSVPYATRVDTLFKYFEIAPAANWEIIWVDGIVRADLKNGDVLRVTAEDGVTIKDYDISVDEYAANVNVNLGAITWPDKIDYLEFWQGDTIPGFDPSKTVYTVTLPYGTTNVPALTAHKQAVNARLEISRAVSLTGSLENRTTTFTVMSESPLDSISKVYSVIFEIEKDPSKILDWEGDPIISEIVTTMRSWQFCLEIANPGTKPLDLSEYMIVRGIDVVPGVDVANLVPEAPTDADFKDRYRAYVPGYKFYDDTTSWLLNPGILTLDNDVDPTVEPGDVFVIAAATNNRYNSWTEKELGIFKKEWHNGSSSSTLADDGTNVRNVAALSRRGANSVYLFRIDNDSILEGTKAIGDPLDFTLVDMMGDPVADNIWSVAGVTYNDNGRTTTRRKPNIYKGVSNPIESLAAFGTTTDSSDWICDLFTTANNGVMTNYIGSHVMDPVTHFLSTVTSPVYLVSDGYAGVQTIQGDLAATTVSGFYDNVTKADTGQVFSLHSGTDGTEKGADDPVAGNDTLIVVSADGVNTTIYALIDLAINNNAFLELVGDDTGLTINNLTDSTGTITGVVYGSLVSDVKAKVKTVSDKARMNIIDGAGSLVPLQILNNELVKVPTLVGDDVYFEVTAEDKVTVMLYKVEVEALSSDAFVVSSLYNVDQVNNVIEGLADGTALTSFMMNIEVVKGATAKLLTKYGHERTDGHIAYDDVLLVTSEDGTVTRTYFITFVNETEPDSNSAPQVALEFSEKTIDEPGTILLTATASDDGLPIPVQLTYLWEVTAGNAADVVIESPDALSTNATFNVGGSYTVTFSASDGALVSKADVTVTVGTIGFDNSLTPHMNLYPNPAKDKLTMELSNMPAQNSMISIYNITGSVVYNNMLSSEKTEIDVSGFVSGLYIIKINSGDHSFIHRVEIQ